MTDRILSTAEGFSCSGISSTTLDAGPIAPRNDSACSIAPTFRGGDVVERNGRSFDGRPARGIQDVADIVRVSKGEAARLAAGRRQRAIRRRGGKLGSPWVGMPILEAGENQRSAGARRCPKTSERPHRIGEEHHSVTREDQVERSLATRHGFGVAEKHANRGAGEPLLGDSHQRGRKVAGDYGCVGTDIRKGKAGRSRAATDIERPERALRRRSRDRPVEHCAEPGQRAVDILPTLGPGIATFGLPFRCGAHLGSLKRRGRTDRRSKAAER